MHATTPLRPRGFAITSLAAAIVLVAVLGACQAAPGSPPPTASIPPTSPATPTLVATPTSPATATASPETTVQPQQVAALDLPDSFVNSLIFSPDGHTLISGDRNGEVLLWDAETWENSAFLPARSTYAADDAADVWFWSTLALSPDGRTIVQAYGEDGMVTGRDLAGKQLFAFPYGARVYSLTFSPDGKLLALGGLADNVVIYDLAAGQPAADLPSDHSLIVNLVFSPDGKRLIASYNDPTHLFVIWDTATWQPIDTFSLGTSELVPPHDVLWSPDGTQLVLAGMLNPEIWIMDLKTRKVVAGFHEHTRAPYQIALSPDARLLASAGDDGRVGIWDLEANALVKMMRIGNWELGAITFSPDGRLLVFSVWRKGVQVWTVEGGTG